MVGEYLNKFYAPASTRGHEFLAGGYAVARELAAWKRKVRAGWPKSQLRAVELPSRNVPFGDRARFTVGVHTDGLGPDDVAVELMLNQVITSSRQPANYQFTYSGKRGEGGEYLYTLDLSPDLCGKLEYRIRAFPFHRALSHRFEMGLMKWV
jgi:starch phosphorylase